MESQSWQKWPLTILEERKNFLRLLLAFKEASLFETVLEFWEKASIGLWELGYWNDYFQCTNIALEAANVLDNASAQARLLRELGWCYMEWEDFSTARKYLNKSLQKARLAKDFLGKCNALRYLGVLSHRQKKLNSSLEYYRKALTIISPKRPQIPSNQQNEWAFQEASLHNLLGSLYLKLQDFPASYQELSASLTQYHLLGEPYRYYQAAPLLNLGVWYFLHEDYGKAREYYQKCYQLSQEIGRTDTVSSSILRLAQLAQAQGNIKEALDLIDRVVSISGNEILSVREHAFRLKDEILTNN